MTQNSSQEILVDLIIKARRGDRSAYSQVVRQFQDLAVGYAYSILRNFSLAEEAAQEALIEAYLNLDRLQKPAAFPGWLKRIVFKQCDRITRKKRLPAISLAQTDEPISFQPTPILLAEQQELQNQIHNSIERLPDREREVIALFYLAEQSQKEIGAFLEIPVSTVKNRLFSARKKLQQNCQQMVEDYLSSQRPSQDDGFVQKIEQIIEAACTGDNVTVQKLLKQNARLANAKDSNIQSTPLHHAAHRGYYYVVRSLLANGADVNAQEGNYSQSTPLHWAATGGHLEISKLLVKKGAKLDAIDRWNNLTPLGWASIIRYDHGDCPLGEQHREIQAYLLDCGAELDIFSAIFLDEIDKINTSINRNPEVLERRLGFALSEFQPLHFAIAKNKTEIAQLLIKRGADLQAKTSFGVTPLTMSLQAKNESIIKLLHRQVPYDLSALLVTKQWAQAEKIICNQPNIIKENTSLFHYTIINGLIEATTWLLDRGADIEARNKYELGDYVMNITPLHIAVEENQLEITRLLLDLGGNINAITTGELKATALHVAIVRENINLVRLLLQYNPDLTIKDNIRLGTPLDWAKKFQQLEAIELLEKREQDINIKDNPRK